MDIIYLKNLKVETVIGVHPWERRMKQRLFLDLELGADISKAAASDDVADTVDYSAVATRIEALAAESEYSLVESLAERIARMLQQEFSVPWLRLSLSKKGAVPNADAVGVTIERGK